MVLFDQVIKILAGSDLHSPRKFPIFLHLPHRPMGCCIGVRGDLRRFTRVLHRSAEKALGRIHIPLSAQKEIDRSPCLIHRPVEVDPMSADLYIRLIHPPGSADWPSITLPPLLEFRQVMLDPTENRGVGQRNAPIRHHDDQVARLNLKLAYQLTQRMMICPSKCRPLNSASTGKNRCILSSSPDHSLFAPEPSLPLLGLRPVGDVASAVENVSAAYSA